MSRMLRPSSLYSFSLLLGLSDPEPDANLNTGVAKFSKLRNAAADWLRLSGSGIACARCRQCETAELLIRRLSSTSSCSLSRSPKY